jgi:hypothetical protein
MKSGTDRICSYPYEPVRALGSRCRHHEARPFGSSHASRNAVWCVVFALAATLGMTDNAIAQEPVGLRPVPIDCTVPGRPHHWCDFFSPNAGIPRTYSYDYSPWLNQPRHFRVHRPDGTTYWTSTVRGLPIGYQWLAQ